MHQMSRRRSSALRLDEKVQLEIRKIDAENSTIFDLFRAINKHDYASVNTILSRGIVDVNGTDKRLWTPLMVASACGDEKSTGKLLTAGADTDHADTHGCTALMVAACTGHRCCLELIVNARADVEQQDDYGNTALSMAAVRGRVDCIRGLLRAGASVETADNDGLNPISIAGMHGQTAALNALLEGADREISKMTLAHTAAIWDRANTQVRAEGDAAGMQGYRLAAVEDMLGLAIRSPGSEQQATVPGSPASIGDTDANASAAISSEMLPTLEDSSTRTSKVESSIVASGCGTPEIEESALEKARRLREGAAAVCDALESVGSK